MITIKLHTVQAVLSDFDIPISELNAFAKVVKGQILTEVYSNLVQAAKQKLSTSRAQYIAGITLDEDSIYLEGFLPNAVEDGVSGYDMKGNFEKSDKVKRSKNGGWYLTIPFRIGTPNAGGILTSSIMPREVYNAIRNGKKANTNDLPVKTRGAVTDLNTGKIWEQYENKFSIFAGITQKKNEVTNRSTYSTFRRVSSNSDPNSWINSGIAAHNLFDEAWANTDIDRIINEGIDILF